MAASAQGTGLDRVAADDAAGGVAMERQAELIAREKAKSGFRGKVNAKCIECIYDQHSGTGTWRQQVEACTAVKCPLYDVRPTSSASDEAEE